MTTEVPIQEVAPHEVLAQDPEAVRAAFELSMSREVPSFILRASGVELGDNPRQTMLDIARAGAEAATGQNHQLSPTFDTSVSPGAGSEAGFHADDNISDKPDAYHVHITESEQPSKLKTANPGPDLAGSDISVRYDDRLNNLLAEGKTDPSLVDPQFHVGETRNYDAAVFRVRGSSPTWHDVTTPEDSRVATATVLSPVPASTPSEPVDNSDTL